MGWSKGPGIAANVAFTLTQERQNHAADEFKLRGKSFAIDGDIALAGGGLSSARLKSVQLNRGDERSVTIDRKGKGFNIDVTGNSLDVRAIVKMLKAEPDGATDKAATRPISIDAKLGQADRLPRRDAVRRHIEL